MTASWWLSTGCASCRSRHFLSKWLWVSSAWWLCCKREISKNKCWRGLGTLSLPWRSLVSVKQVTKTSLNSKGKVWDSLLDGRNFHIESEKKCLENIFVDFLPHLFLFLSVTTPSEIALVMVTIKLHIAKSKWSILSYNLLWHLNSISHLFDDIIMFIYRWVSNFYSNSPPS
jgi:hypothetical protein